MNRTINAAAAEKRGVRGVDDRINLQAGEVATENSHARTRRRIHVQIRSLSSRGISAKSIAVKKPSASKSNTRKSQVKVRDLKPRKDAKGGVRKAGEKQVEY